MKTPSTIALISLVLCLGCSGQSAGTRIAESHIDANVPKTQEFDAYMKRDLASYLCKSVDNCRVEYQLLREGPTQTGISYPKFYVWAVCSQQDKVLTEGAARVAAIDKRGFTVTNFVTRKEIQESPRRIQELFPAALVPNILKRAQ